MTTNKTDKTAELDAMLSQMPAEIVQAVATHGFDKLAAAVYGLPEINEHTVAAFIGTKLATQQQEWRDITSGLKALQNLSTTQEEMDRHLERVHAAMNPPRFQSRTTADVSTPAEIAAHVEHVTKAVEQITPRPAPGSTPNWGSFKRK